MPLPRLLLLFTFIAAFAANRVASADNKRAPDFQEVYELLRTNLAGVDEKTLNRAAVEGLLAKLESKVHLVENESKTSNGTNVPASVTGSVLEGNFGYLRVNALNAGANKAFLEAYQKVSTNRLKGIVIDLRYSGGTDYADAAAMADLFLPSEQPLLDWGKGMRKSNTKGNAISVPVVLLVNGYTSGAAEALAGIMRQTEIGLVIGSKTSGQASIAKEFPLSDGSHLLIPTTPVILGSGKPMPTSGLVPDIAVEVSGEDERQYYADAYKPIRRPPTLGAFSGISTNDAALSLTNRASRRRINEAELVRMQRDGQSIDLDVPPLVRESAPGKPALQDPALSRALDLLKGLAVVQQFRPSL
jgi:hypothetical protein